MRSKIQTVSVMARHFTGMENIPVEMQKEVIRIVSEIILIHDNHYLRNELYKLYRTPPFVLTEENEIVFTGECEIFSLE